MRRPGIFILVLVLGIVVPEGTGIITGHYHDFDGTQVVAPDVADSLSGAPAEKSVEGWSAVGFPGNLLTNDSWNPISLANLTLSRLPAHNSVNIVPMLQVSANNMSGTTAFNGHLFESAPYGWWNSGLDKAFDMSAAPVPSLAQTVSTPTGVLHTDDGGGGDSLNEPWGIEKPPVPLSAIPSTVPEPATVLLLGLALLGIAALRRTLSK